MNSSYKTFIILDDSKQVIISDLPFQSGQKLEINIKIFSQETTQDELLERWKKFLKKTQEIHTDYSLTDEEIQAEIDAYRQEQ